MSGVQNDAKYFADPDKVINRLRKRIVLLEEVSGSPQNERAKFCFGFQDAIKQGYPKFDLDIFNGTECMMYFGFTSGDITRLMDALEFEGEKKLLRTKHYNPTPIEMTCILLSRMRSKDSVSYLLSLFSK